MSGPKTSVLSPNFVCYSALSENVKAEWAVKEILVSLQSIQSNERAIASMITRFEAFRIEGCPDEKLEAIIQEARFLVGVTFDDIDENHSFSAGELAGIRKDGAEDVFEYRPGTINTAILEGKYLEYFQSVRDKSFGKKTNIARACAAKVGRMKQFVNKQEILLGRIESTSSNLMSIRRDIEAIAEWISKIESWYGDDCPLQVMEAIEHARAYCNDAEIVLEVTDKANTLTELSRYSKKCEAFAKKLHGQLGILKKIHSHLYEIASEAWHDNFAVEVGAVFYIPFSTVRNRKAGKEQIDRINNALSELADLELSDTLLRKIGELADKAAEITDSSYLSNFYQLVVRPFVEECTQYDAFYNAHYAEYEEYKTSYEILCGELNLVPQEMEISPESIAFYKAKTLELQGILLQRQTRERVMEIVNEVMAEMGYDLVASRDVVKKSGKQYHDELYLYGDGTAISVVQSSEGQLTMEIGGLDYGDRTPTEEEAKSMESLMVSFCGDYEAIAEALVKKGLDMKKVSLLPPDAQYATIINLDDYEVSGPVETITEAKKEERRAEDTKKERHAEE